MTKAKKKLELNFERTIPALPGDVYEAWLNPKVPGNPWNYGDKLILNPKVDGLFYLLTGRTAHYGRFTELARGKRIQHTWMSPNTLGEESTVTVTFEKQGTDTLMTLVHADLPDHELGRTHDAGWNYFLDLFPKQFPTVSHEQK